MICKNMGLFKYFLLGLLLFFFINKANSSEENIEKSIDINDVKKLGLYQPIQNYPIGMRDKFNSNCIEIICQGQKAGSEVYYRFVKKKKTLNKYPGKMMKAMAWYEVYFHSNLKKNDLFIKRYLLNEGEDYNEKEIDIIKIKSLLSSNESRENMRKSLGMTLETNVEEAINNFWVMGEFLDKGKPKKRKVEKDMIKRKKIITKYKSQISQLLQKIDENN